MINKFNNARRMVYETLNFMYIEIYVYLSFIYPNSENNKYNFSEVDNKFIYVRKIIDKILKYQDNINKMLGHPDFKDFLQSQFIEMINMAYDESVLNIFNDRNEYTSRFNLRFKFTSYNSIGILNKETNQIDLFKLLEEDAKSSDSKEAKKYFDIWGEDCNGLSIEDYLLYNSFPKDQKDISDEQFIIKNTIERIVSNLKYYLKDFYFQISLYCILQYEPEYRELLNRITSIQILEGKINDIVSTYFDKDSSLHSYIDINQINEDIFNEQINSLIEDPNINLVGEHLYKLKRYKKYIEDIIKDDSDISIFELLFKDAYTDNAKKYFNKED